MPQKVEQYKIWIHIEGLDADGDCVEGDDYHQPHEVACVQTLTQAEELRDRLIAMWTE